MPYLDTIRRKTSRREFARIVLASTLGVRLASSRVGAIPPIIIRDGSINLDLFAGLQLTESTTGAPPFQYRYTTPNYVLNAASFTGTCNVGTFDSARTDRITAILLQTAPANGVTHIRVSSDEVFEVASSTQLALTTLNNTYFTTRLRNASDTVSHIRIERAGAPPVVYPGLQAGWQLRLD